MAMGFTFIFYNDFRMRYGDYQAIRLSKTPTMNTKICKLTSMRTEENPESRVTLDKTEYIYIYIFDLINVSFIVISKLSILQPSKACWTTFSHL